jgi:CheY-like chemotaxis protein
LVVDDQEENRLVLQNMLTPLGFDVATVNNGAQCLSYVARHGVDLIFMDCRMPGLDGFETTAALRIDPHWQALPVIAVSTSALELDHNQSQNAVFNGFLAKPIKETELLSILADMLDLTWVYSQPAPDTAEKTAVVMPELNDLHTLLHLAELGKIPKIEAWVADLQHRQPACYQFAERIMRLTRQFDDEAICTLAQNAIQDHASNNEQ